MQQNDLSQIRERVAATLPRKYEPLLLTFYGHEARAAGDEVIIGDDYGTELHLTSDGSIVSTDPAGQLPQRFVNSSIEHLAQFLEVVSSTERSNDDREREMWRRLAELDPRAFADEENWWAVILAQARQENSEPLSVMEDASVHLTGELSTWPDKDGMAAILRDAGLGVYVGPYSVRVENCSHFVFQDYGGDLGEPTIDADASSLDEMMRDGNLVSDALARAGIRHRFELYDADNERVGYLHHDCPLGDAE